MDAGYQPGMASPCTRQAPHNLVPALCCLPKLTSGVMDNFFHTFKTTSSQNYQSPFLDCIARILGFKQKIPN